MKLLFSLLQCTCSACYGLLICLAPRLTVRVCVCVQCGVISPFALHQRALGPVGDAVQPQHQDKLASYGSAWSSASHDPGSMGLIQGHPARVVSCGSNSGSQDGRKPVSHIHRNIDAGQSTVLPCPALPCSALHCPAGRDIIIPCFAYTALPFSWYPALPMLPWPGLPHTNFSCLSLLDTTPSALPTLRCCALPC